ncbi:Kinesin-like protein kif19 [Chamberlinius hualienensis]
MSGEASSVKTANEAGSSDDLSSVKLIVAVRIRPLKQEDYLRGELRIAHIIGDNMVVLIDSQDDRFGVLRSQRALERQYMFDMVFDGGSSQELVYRQTTQPLVDMVMNGFNATVFAYGATGAGKTHTMVGTDNDPGVMVRSLGELFRRVQETSNEISYRVTMSYLEIYNEMIRDLLNPSSGCLELREDVKKVQVVGLTQISTNSTKEVMKLLARGNRARTVESTAANQTSSRSHALLEIQVRQQSRLTKTKEEKIGKLYLIDLAGSERAAQTQNRGKRLLEGAHINRSLLALGNCINALADRNSNRYVNYRDSKLTRLLKDALGGNCRTAMIAHINPAASQFDESRNTLVYADRAKNIRNKVRQNVVDVSYHVAQYQTIIGELKNEIQRLKIKMDSPQMPPVKFRLKGTERKSTSENRMEMGKLKDDLVKYFNEQMELRRQLMEIDAHVLQLSIEFEKQSMVISEWETEKSKTPTKSDAEREPTHIRQAWDDLMYIQEEQQKYWDMRQDVDRQYKDCRRRAATIEDELPYRIDSSHEQRDILNLLCKVHELEIEKMEMSAESLLKEHELRRKDMMILRYGRQRNLCDEIIAKQKAIIESIANGNTGKPTVCPPDLQELYNQYQLEMTDMWQREELVKSAISNSLYGDSTHPRSRRAQKTRSIPVKLPMLIDDHKPPTTRGGFSDSEINTKHVTSPPRTSLTAPTIGINSLTITDSSEPSPVTLPVILPPHEESRISSSGKKTLEAQIQDSVRNINAVAARRRSVRTADRRYLESWHNTRNQTRDLSADANFNNKLMTSLTLNYSKIPGSSFHGVSQLAIYNESGNIHPKKPIYYPPTFKELPELKDHLEIISNSQTLKLQDPDT